jgi:hypothetical protein
MLDAACSYGSFSYQGGESLLFPVPARKIPVLMCREFVCKTLKLIRDLISKIINWVRKTANSLLFSLFSGNSMEKNGETIAVPGPEFGAHPSAAVTRRSTRA